MIVTIFMALNILMCELWFLVMSENRRLWVGNLFYVASIMGSDFGFILAGDEISAEELPLELVCPILFLSLFGMIVYRIKQS